MGSVTQSEIDVLTDQISKLYSKVEDLDIDDTDNRSFRDDATSALDDARAALEGIDLALEDEEIEEELENDGDVPGTGEDGVEKEG